MDKRYKVIFSSLIKEKASFKSQMNLLGISEDVSEAIIAKAPVTLKKNLSLGEARRYADAILQAGGRATIQADEIKDNSGQNESSSGIITLKNFVMCPRCGLKQVKAETCIKCGFLY